MWGSFLALIVGIVSFIAWAINTTPPMPIWTIALIAGGGVLFILENILTFRRMRTERDANKGKVTELEQSQISMGQKAPSRTEAIESAEVAWGLWRTGHRMTLEHLIAKPSLQRILVSNPKAVTERSNNVGILVEEPTIIHEIMGTTSEALANHKDIRWYSYFREVSLTICDPTPKEENGIPKPYSENAIIYIEYQTPYVGVEVWSRCFTILNKGKDKQVFAGFFKEYEDIWEKAIIPTLADIGVNDTKI